MPTPLVRARWLAPALLLLALNACGESPTQARREARLTAANPTHLWRVQSLASDGVVTGELLVCADATLRAGFERANAEINGRPCAPRKDAIEKVGLYANRCQMNGRWYGMTVNRRGDPARDFTVSFALRALDGTGANARQVRRYRLVGACPAGWGIGDQAHPGGKRIFNALAGTWGQ